MQFAAALIEYLITGIVASVWVITLINHYTNLPLDIISDYKEIFVVVFFPVAYILGIYVDVASSFFIRRMKSIHESLKKFQCYLFVSNSTNSLITFFAGKPKDDSYERSSKILSYSPPDLIRTMEAYVSRDRIARGMGLNSAIGAIVAYITLTEPLNQQVAIICAVVFIISFATWHRLRRLSSRFKKIAIEKLTSPTTNTQIWSWMKKRS